MKTVAPEDAAPAAYNRHSGESRNPASCLGFPSWTPTVVGVTNENSGAGRRGAGSYNRHSSESRNPASCLGFPSWTPTFVGVTNENSGAGRRGAGSLQSSFRLKPESSFMPRLSKLDPGFRRGDE